MSFFFDEIYLTILGKFNLFMPCHIAFESTTFPLSSGLINYIITFEIIKFLFFKNGTL